MRHVRCMFRVLTDTNSHDGARIVRIAPTYSTRDGKPCEENRWFWEATPTGEGELFINSACPLGQHEMFRAGSYLYLDMISDEQEVIGRAEGAIRTDWVLSELTLSPTQFKVRMDVDTAGYGRTDPNNHRQTLRATCRNAALFGEYWARGELAMTISNLAAIPFFRFEPQLGGQPRKLVVDFSPA